MASTRRSTLRDVARAAGVSHMTASRVVRGEGSVSGGTRQRVETAVRLTGYRPDPALSALAAYRTRQGGGQGSVIAFLDCDPDDYSRMVFDGAREEAERLGYRIERHELSRTGASQRRLGRLFFHGGIRGLLFGPSNVPWDFEGWEWEQFAPVSLGALTHRPAMNNVAMDYFDGVMKAIACLQESGARRIGLAVDPDLEFRTGHRWLGGYAAQQLTGRIPVYAGNPESRKSLREWRKKYRLEGVLTIHRSVWEALRSASRVLFLNSLACPPGVPCVIFEARRIGLEGVRIVHHQILNREFGLPTEIKTLSLQGIIGISGNQKSGAPHGL